MLKKNLTSVHTVQRDFQIGVIWKHIQGYIRVRNHISVLIVIKSTQINQLLEGTLRLMANKFTSALYAKIGNSKYGILTGKLHITKMIQLG